MKIKLSIAILVCTSTLFAFSLTRSQFDSKTPEKVYLSSVKNPAQKQSGLDQKNLSPEAALKQAKADLEGFDISVARLLADESLQGSEQLTLREIVAEQQELLHSFMISNVSCWFF